MNIINRSSLITALLTVGLSAQPTLTLSGPSSALPGSTIPIPLTLSGSSGLNVSALGWLISSPSPSSSISVGSVSTASASTAASKTIYCMSGNLGCVAVGFSSSLPPVSSDAVYADGAVATIPVTLSSTAAGTFTIALSSAQAVDNNGMIVPGSVVLGSPLVINIGSKCDVNSDGVIDNKDVSAVLTSALSGGTNCPLGAGACTLQAIVDVILATLPGGSCKL